MFEQGAALRTWACESVPREDRDVNARQLADHRPDYLQHEGPVSGDRGCVARWDEGEYEITCDQPQQWSARLRGRRLVGDLVIRLIDPDTQYWVVRFAAHVAS